MKKYFLVTCLFLVLGSFAQAQDGGGSLFSGDRFLPKFGFMYEFFTLKPQDTSFQQIIALNNGGSPSLQVPYYTMMLGTYYVLAHKNDIVSVGIDASLQGGLNFRPGISYQIQLPIYVMGHLGARSTSYNEQKVGIALGVGGQTSYLNEKRSFLGIDTQPKKIFVFNPSAIVEVYLRQGMGSTLTGRLHVPLLTSAVKIPALVNNFNQSEKWNVGNFGLGLIYSF